MIQALLTPGGDNQKIHRLAAHCLAAFSVLLFLGLSVTSPARADVYTTFDFTAYNTTYLFGQPLPYSLFGQFTVDNTTGTTYSSDFWVQYPGAANGEFKLANGQFSSTSQIKGFDVTGNNIVLTFATNLLSVSPGQVDVLTQVNFDNSFSVDNSPTGGVCIAGSCPNGNAAENPSQLVPEPATLPLMMAAVAGIVLIRSRRTNYFTR